MESEQRQTTARDLRDTLRKAAEQVSELMVPSAEARKHFRQARVQVLMGVRELVDQRIAQLSRDETKGTRVTVE